MKVLKILGRMFVRAPVGDNDAPCAGCAGQEGVRICQALPNCLANKHNYKEIIFKENKNA